MWYCEDRIDAYKGGLCLEKGTRKRNGIACRVPHPRIPPLPMGPSPWKPKEFSHKHTILQRDKKGISIVNLTRKPGLIVPHD